MDDAMHLRKPDRFPVAPLTVHFYPTRVRGISNRDAMYQPEKTFQAWAEAVVRHNWDAAPSGIASLPPARPLEILGLKQFQWPGGGLADTMPFQWVEAEYMKQDKYDEMLADPNGFTIKKLWPRISTTLAAVSGNVPASLMVTGTPQPVKDQVKDLIDTFGDNGGLIVDSTMGIPDESKEENVQALTDAVHEYGAA
jgi:uroporphyrinogen-III decarboxylase